MDHYKGRLSLSDEVYHQILAKIEDKEWKVGEKLPSESKLCAMFGVSRTSVRAALQNLQGSNIIVTVQGVGSFVHRNPKEVGSMQMTRKASDISGEEFQEFFGFRQAVEFKAIELFVARATKEDIEALKHYVNQMQEAAHQNDAKQFTEVDYAFHMKIIEGACNRFLEQAMKQNEEIFYHYLEEIVRLSDKPLTVLAEEHIELYTYLAEKKSKQAKEYLFCDNSYYQVAYFNLS